MKVSFSSELKAVRLAQLTRGRGENPKVLGSIVVFPDVIERMRAQYLRGVRQTELTKAESDEFEALIAEATIEP